MADNPIDKATRNLQDVIEYFTGYMNQYNVPSHLELEVREILNRALGSVIDKFHAEGYTITIDTKSDSEE